MTNEDDDLLTLIMLLGKVAESTRADKERIAELEARVKELEIDSESAT